MIWIICGTAIICTLLIKSAVTDFTTNTCLTIRHEHVFYLPGYIELERTRDDKGFRVTIRK